MSDVRFGVVVVNFRTPALTIRCIASILDLGLCDPANIVVVENGSDDGSFEMLERKLEGVRILRSPKNGGFGAGVNLGLSVVGEKYALILNPDTYFVDRSVFGAIEFMEQNAKVGIVGLDLRNPDMSLQYGGRKVYSMIDIVVRRISLLRIFAWAKRREKMHLMKERWSESQPFRADWVMGTGFLIRKSLALALGGMDERYFLYFEDVDLCVRARKIGFEVFGVPKCVLVHDHQRASSGQILSWAARQHLRSLFIFWRRHGLEII